MEPKVRMSKLSLSKLPLSINDLLSPMEPQAFVESYWEKDRLLLSRNQIGFFDHLFSIDDIDRWLESQYGKGPGCVLVTPPSGVAGPKDNATSSYYPGELVIGRASEALADGCSIVINGLEKSWHPLAPMVESLGQFFCADIGVNMYLTPKGSKAFSVHVDNHDVFILQVSGRKKWQLYELTELPVARLDYRAELNHPPYWSKLENAPLLQESLLCPGDVLYIPRGMPHCAIAEDSHSLHLTFAVNSYYWLDFFKAAIEQACFEAKSLRRALPPGFVEGPESLHAGMKEVFDKALAEINENISFEAALRVLRRRRVTAQGFPRDGHLSQVLRLDELSLDSQVERRSGVACFLEVIEDYQVCSLRFGSEHLRGPVRLRKPFEFVRDQHSFRVADLPGLDDQGKLVLVRRLIRTGLLRFS